MAYANVISRGKAQVAIETGGRGVEVATMTRQLILLQNGFSWTYEQARSDEPEMLGDFDVDRDTVLMERKVTFRMEARLAFEDVPWWWSICCKGGVGTRTGVTTGSTPPGYSYALGLSGVDDLDTFSLKVGEGVIYKFKRCVVNQWTMRANLSAGGEATWRIAIEGSAIFVGTTTFDSPTAITRTMISSKAGNLTYLDTTLAIATTILSGKVRSWSLTGVNNIEEKWLDGTSLDAGLDVARGNRRYTGELVLEALTDDEFALMRSNTPVKLAFANEGAQIGTTPTTKYRQFLYAPQAKFNAPARGHAGQNEILTFPFLAERPASGFGLSGLSVSALAAVAA